jgi:hypothetical protein
MDKRESELRHATKRAKERYHLLLTRQDLDSIAKIIQQGGSVFSRKISNTRSVHDLQYEDTLIRVVYDKLRNCLVTFLHVRQNEKIQR